MIKKSYVDKIEEICSYWTDDVGQRMQNASNCAVKALNTSAESVDRGLREVENLSKTPVTFTSQTPRLKKIKNDLIKRIEDLREDIRSLEEIILE